MKPGDTKPVGAADGLHCYPKCRAPNAAAIHLILLAFLSASACLDPLVSDVTSRPGVLKKSDDPIPNAVDNARLAAQIDVHDGIDESLVRLRTGFVAGQPARFWDFGEASPAAIPLYLPVRAAADGPFVTETGAFEPIGHAPVFDAIPGDPGYSPWWTVVLVPITDAWDDDLLTSFEAVDEAVRRGLVLTPIALPIAVNCPVVLPTARLEQPDDTAAKSPSVAYWRGQVVHYFDLGVAPVNDGIVGVGTVYTLRREGGEPISEMIRGVDINGDGDLDDTNDIFSNAPGLDAYTGFYRRVRVIIASEIESIDTDNTDGTALTSVEDLFTLGDKGLVARPDRVVAVYPDTAILNRPLATPIFESEP